MIHEIEIQNFGCIHNATVRLTRFHAFVGPNGAGKSTLFDAIQMISNVTRGQMFDPAWRSVGTEPAGLLAKTRDDLLRFAWVVVSKTSQGNPFLRRIVHADQSAPMDCVRFEPASWAHERTPSLGHGDSTLECLENVSDSADPGRVVLVEHPESYLYPGAIAPMMSSLRALSERAQVLITTHSPLALNEMRSEEVTLVRRDSETGPSVFTPITETPNFADRSKVYALGELWVSYLDKIYLDRR